MKSIVCAIVLLIRAFHSPRRRGDTGAAGTS